MCLSHFQEGKKEVERASIRLKIESKVELLRSDFQPLIIYSHKDIIVLLEITKEDLTKFYLR